ncbi:hypothetical protein AB0I53_32700 [Saccharopolyspora sp. NPDC050389]|uniref:hypothetical protein n=1 Tax=Saccharopolyspora sp. NPDC050389 TaxID=3155516 RepID=UPI0033E9AECD
MSELERLRVALTTGARLCREQHGAHLPLATDSMIAHIIATRLCDASIRATMLHAIVIDIADANRCRNQRTADAKIREQSHPGSGARQTAR